MKFLLLLPMLTWSLLACSDPGPMSPASLPERSSAAWSNPAEVDAEIPPIMQPLLGKMHAQFPHLKQQIAKRPAAKKSGLTASAYPVASRYDVSWWGCPVLPDSTHQKAEVDTLLYGTWFVDITEDVGIPSDITFVFDEDGSMQVEFYVDFTELDLWSILELEFSDAGEDFELPELPPLGVVQAFGYGTYSVSGDIITPNLTEAEVFINGKDHIEYFTEVAQIMAAFSAEYAGIPEEEYAEYEANFVEGFVAEYGEDYAEDDYFSFLNDEKFTYEVDGEELTLTDSIGIPLTFERVDGV